MEELASTIPVSPPTVNKKINPRAHSRDGEKFKWVPYKVLNHLKILIPVGIAIIIVADVK